MKRPVASLHQHPIDSASQAAYRPFMSIDGAADTTDPSEGDAMRVTRIVLFAVLCVVGLSQSARAQNAGDAGWNVAVYPILAWVPLGIDIDVDVPPINGDAGGAGKIIDSRLDGAFFGGASASNGVWRIEAYAIWASVGGDRPDRPFLD